MRALAVALGLAALAGAVRADEVEELAAFYAARSSLPDLASPPFVVVEFDGRPHEWGFARADGRVLTGDLRTLAFSPDRYRVRGREFGRFVEGHLDRVGDGGILFDVERGDPYARFAVLIVALEQRGEKTTARRVHVLATRWFLDPATEMRAGLGLAALHRLRERIGDPRLDWATLAAEGAALRRDFPVHGPNEFVRALERTAALTPDDGLVYTLRDVRRDRAEREDLSRRLVARGFAAVPALLAVAGDDRLTRRVRREPRNVGPPVTIGGHARTMLGRIAGRTFDTKREAADWWKWASRDGEPAYLVRQVGLGGAGAARLAPRLERLAPERATAAVAEGLRFTTRPAHRVRLVRALDPARPEARAVLRRTLAADDAALVAGAAAAVLEPHDADFVHRTLAARWDADPTPPLARLLARYGLPFAPERLSVRARLELARSDPPEEILVQQLADDAFVGGEVEGLRRFVRVCDVAARALARRMPERYEFDDAAPEPVRDRRIASMRNRYRVGRGLEPVPEPAPPRPPVLLLEEALDLGDLLAARPMEALRRIEEAGVAAAPWIERWRRRTRDRAVRASLARLDAALHTTLAAVEVVGSDTLAGHLRSARGHVFGGHEVMAWLVARTDRTLREVDRYTFLLWREQGAPGLFLRIVAGEASARGAPRHVVLVRSDGRTLFTAFRRGEPSQKGRHDFTRWAQSALQADTPFEIKIVVRR